MDSANKRRKNLFQNLVILALTLSAAFLFAQAQLYSLGGREGYLSGRLADRAGPPSASVLTDLAAPVRAVVTGDYGRYGTEPLTTGDDGFSALGALLREALGSAGDQTVRPAADFRAALGAAEHYGSSVYYDFGDPLPLSVLAGLLGAEWNGGDVSARRCLLYAQGEAVSLFLWDGGAVCRAASTAVTAGALAQLAAEYPLGGAFFAFDQGEAYAYLDPFSLFTGQPPQSPPLTAAAGLTDTDAVLTALSFNPHTNSRYTEPTGVEVVTESDRSVRIQPGGTVVYQSGGGPLHVSAAGPVPTQPEAALGAYRLLASLLSGVQSDAGLYLRNIKTDGQTTRLTFDYQSGGRPIRLSDGAAAAEVVLEGTAVTALTLRMRQYTAGEGAAPLLPLAQALSIARAYPGAELTACYVDDGGAAPTVQWLAES